MDVYEELMRVFGRRMVCVVISAVQLQGEHAGKQVTRFYPGFVISVGERWLIVTAGHSIRELDEALQNRLVQIVVARLLDCFSPDAPHQEPAAASFPFDYEASQRFGIYFDNDKDTGHLDGRDFGFIRLTEDSVRLLSANGIRPLDESLWLPPEGTTLDEHILVGIPDQLVDARDRGSDTDFFPENVCILLRETPGSRAQMEADQATHKRLIRELPTTVPIDSVVGMSGGPIFAIGDGPHGRGRVWVMAIQSKQKGNYVFGFPFQDVVRYVQEAVAQLNQRST